MTPLEAERFWAKVEKTPDGCWLWTGAKQTNGYGSFALAVDGRVRSRLVHRLSWEIEHGEIPEGLKVCHRCLNRACVRPDHLFLGDTQDHVDLCVARGRNPAGERNGRAALSDAVIKQIRDAYASGSKSLVELAEEHGLNQMYVSQLCRGRFRKSSPGCEFRPNRSPVPGPADHPPAQGSQSMPSARGRPLSPAEKRTYEAEGMLPSSDRPLRNGRSGNSGIGDRPGPERAPGPIASPWRQQEREKTPSEEIAAGKLVALLKARNKPTTTAEMRAEVRMKTQTFFRALRLLAERGQIAREGRAWTLAL